MARQYSVQRRIESHKTVLTWTQWKSITPSSLTAQFMKQARRFVTRAQTHSADWVVTPESWERLHRSTRAEKCISSCLWCEGRHSRFGMQPGVGQSDGGRHKQIRNIITPEKRRCCRRHIVSLRPANHTVYPGGRCEWVLGDLNVAHYDLVIDRPESVSSGL